MKANNKSDKISYDEDKNRLELARWRAEIPIEIVEYKNIYNLSLSFGNSALKELPPELFQMTNVVSINLGSNSIKFIPREINQLTRLKTLTFYSNYIKELPIELFDILSLLDLNVGHNLISFIPP